MTPHHIYGGERTALEQVARYEGNFLYPTDYRIYRIGEHLGLKFEQSEKMLYVRVVNVDKIRPKTYQDTSNWLLAAAGKTTKGDLGDLLETEPGELNIWAMGMASDRELELRLHMPASTQRGGHKEKTDAVITPMTSPFYAPTVTFPTYMAYFPHYELTNPTEYTNRWAMLSYFGYAYGLKQSDHTAKKPPKRCDTVAFEGVR